MYVLAGASYPGVSGDKTDTSREAGCWLATLKYTNPAPSLLAISQNKVKVESNPNAYYCVCVIPGIYYHIRNISSGYIQKLVVTK